MSEKPLETLDLNLLMALHWLLTERNVTAAAGRLGLSQPAASRALARLRLVFADPILVKSGSVMAPTRLGEKLQPIVAHSIETMRDVLRVSDVFTPEKQTGVFRVGCIDYVGAMLFDAWKQNITPVAPNLDLQMVELTIENGRDLVSGKIDLVLLPEFALKELPASVDVEQFVIKEVCEEKFVCALRNGHALAKTKLSLKKYAALDHILISPQGGKYGVVDQVLKQHDLTRRIAYRPASFLLALHIVQHSDCILTAPASLFDVYNKGLSLFAPPVPIPSHKLICAWHPNWTHDERHRWIRDRLHQGINSC